MQPHYDEDAMARAMGEVDSSLYNPTSPRPSQASSAQPKLTFKQSFERFKQNREMHADESVKAYGEWWDARMKGMNKSDRTEFVSLMTVGNGFCRKQADKCLNGLFPKYEHYPEFLNWLDTQGVLGKKFHFYLMSHAMPAMVAKVHAEGKGGSKSKSKSMRRRRNRRKSKTNKRRR